VFLGKRTLLSPIEAKRFLGKEWPWWRVGRMTEKKLRAGIKGKSTNSGPSFSLSSRLQLFRIEGTNGYRYKPGTRFLRCNISMLRFFEEKWKYIRWKYIYIYMYTHTHTHTHHTHTHTHTQMCVRARVCVCDSMNIQTILNTCILTMDFSFSTTHSMTFPCIKIQRCQLITWSFKWHLFSNWKASVINEIFVKEKSCANWERSLWPFLTWKIVSDVYNLLKICQF